jgi:phenylacetate-CoA ligase
MSVLTKSRDIFLFFKFLNKNFRYSLERTKWAPEKMQEYALMKIRNIVDYAYQNSEFYFEKFKKVGYKPGDIKKIEDLKYLPITTKNELREAVKSKKIFPKNIDLKKLIISHTTGSTGQPLELYFDKFGVEARNVNFARGFYFMRVRPLEKFLLIWRKKEMGRVEKIKNFFGLFKQIGVVDVLNVEGSALNNQKLAKIVDEIKKFAPSTIRGYVSALYVIARFIKKNGIEIRPDRIICSAEYLPHSIWDELKETFKCPVYNLYGGSETSLVALSVDDVSKEMFLTDDFYWTEIIDESGSPIYEKGKIGSLIITDYYNLAMPLIRYEVGDMGEFSGKCFGPFRTLKEVYGRINDVFILPGGKLLFSHNWHIYFRDVEGLERFKVVQEKIDEIKIQLLPYDRKLLEKNFIPLKNKIETSFGKDVKFVWEIVDFLPLDKGEKFRAVQSKINWKEYL